MRKWIKYALGLTLFLVIVIFLQVFYPKMTIMTGYSAKAVCSCTFIADRDIESIETEDTGFMPISLAKSVVDLKNKSVTSTVFGMQKRTAYYHEGYGCVLDNDNNPDNNQINYPLPTRTSSTDTELSWPYGSKILSEKPEGIHYEQLSQAINKLFDDPDTEPRYKTRSILVVYKDQIIAEKYSPGFDKASPMIGWSMTKSVLNALFGILVKEQNFDINQKTGIPSWQNDQRKNISFHDMLQMNSGLFWDENYDEISDVTKMLFKAEDVGVIQMDNPPKYHPQIHFNYSSGTSNLLSSLLKKSFKSLDEYHNFPYKMLFNKIGANSMVLETDMSGNFIGSSYSFATTRDWAKFGLLYLHDGVWNGERILPEGWTTYSATPNGTSNGEYGAHFWLNAGGILPDVPRDLYSANGFQGQRVFIIPSKDLVVVRTGYQSIKKEVYNELLKSIIESI